MAAASPLRIALPGATGRMGRMLIRVVADDPQAQIVAASDHPQSQHIGADIGSLNGGEASGVMVSDNAHALFSATPQVVVDFTTPEASLNHARLVASANTPLVLGTTGHNDKQSKEIADLAKKIPIAWCANTSVGVTLLLRLVEEAARRLTSGDWDIEISELHHKHKIDAPSGTALALGRAAAKARGSDFKHDASAMTRQGARPKGSIGFAVTRGGNVAGEHRVAFLGESERLELTHKAADRIIFARGALLAAKWIAAQPKPGIYTMQDVLGLGS